tara:strand:- start:659 stop:796 length:138 start_codon:yes stop_codon:yes gene_type:complete
MSTITIDNEEYKLEDMSERAKGLATAVWTDDVKDAYKTFRESQSV